MHIPPPHNGSDTSTDPRFHLENHVVHVTAVIWQRCDRDKSMLSWNFINVSDKEAFLNISTAVISFQSIALLAGAYLESPAVTLTLLWSENQRSWGRTQHFGEVVLLGLMVPKEAPAERAVDA